MDKKTLEELAGNPEWYPEAHQVVHLVLNAIADSVPPSVIPEEIAGIAKSVFVALTTADIRGHFSVGDEHEWARFALIAESLEYPDPEKTVCTCGEYPHHELCGTQQDYPDS